MKQSKTSMKEQSRWKIWRQSSIFKLSTIGIATLLFFAATEISETIRQDFFLKTICEHLYPNTNVCNTNYNDTIKVQVESKTATYISIAMYLEKGIPIGISLVAGDWSDLHGRKWLILASTFSGVLTFMTYYGLSLAPQFCSEYIWILLLPSIFYAIGGSHSLFMIGMMAHLGDELIGSEALSKSRTIYFAIVEICAMGGAPIGLIFGSSLFTMKGFPITFLASAIIDIFVFSFCQILIPNKSKSKKDESSKGAQNDCGGQSPQNIFRRTYDACFRGREGKLRNILLLLIGSRLIAKIGEDMYMAVMFVYVEDKFEWTIQTYNQWKAAFYIFASIGFLIVTFVLNAKIADPIQSSMGCLTQGLYCYLVGISNNNRLWIMWLASSFGLLRLLPSVIARSVASKIADSNEIGRIFSVYSALEGIIPLIITPCGTYLFNYCLAHHLDTGIVFYCATIFYLCAFSVALFTDLIWKSNTKHMNTNH